MSADHEHIVSVWHLSTSPEQLLHVIELHTHTHTHRDGHSDTHSHTDIQTDIQVADKISATDDNRVSLNPHDQAQEPSFQGKGCGFQANVKTKAI